MTVSCRCGLVEAPGQRSASGSRLTARVVGPAPTQSPLAWGLSSSKPAPDQRVRVADVEMPRRQDLMDPRWWTAWGLWTTLLAITMVIFADFALRWLGS